MRQTVQEYRRRYYAKHKAEVTKRNKIWFDKNREKVLHYFKIRKLGVEFSLEQAQELLKKQGHKCAICAGSNDTSDRSLALDHNHTSKKVRGFLCGRCNKGIGLFKDSKQLLTNAIVYLEQTNG